MPSPFPGMDPFIESQLWEDFHATALPVIRELLLPLLPDEYKAYVQGRIYYSEDGPGARLPRFQPDVTMTGRTGALGLRSTEGGLATLPQKATWSELVEHREAYLEIREAATERVVTVLELLSPTNKRRRHKGRRVFLTKRRRILERMTNYVEIDLLRGGDSVCAVEPHPKGDYYGIVSRAAARPDVDLYTWSLQDVLPAIAIPLLQQHGDVSLHLGQALDIVYDRSHYRNLLRYDLPVEPSLTSVTDQSWLEAVLANATSSSAASHVEGTL